MYIMSFSSFLFPVMVHQQCETPATWLLLKNIQEDKKKVPQTGLRLAANKKKNSSHDTTCVDLCSLFSVGKNRQSH